MSYTISLDAIDLKYLPITHYTRENKAMLFDISSAKKYDYIEFEIFAPKHKETIPPHRTTICQICDICIPTCYIIEHNQSSKHKMYKSIMDSALERAKKYLNEDNNVPDTKKLPYAYFCDICCLELLTSEKEIHERSHNHCEELKKEKQLKTFLCLYSLSVLAAEDDEELFMTADSESISSNEDKGRLHEADNIFKLVEPEVKPFPTKSRRLRQRSKKTQIESKPDVSDETLVEPKVKIEAEPKVKIEAEPKALIEINTKAGKQIPEAMLEKASILLNEKFLELKLINGTIIYVFEHYYNGFISIMNDITICLLCNELVRNTLTHKKSPKHSSRVKVPVGENCVRQIQNNLNHCILCNEIFPDVTNHIDSNNLHLTTVSEVNNNVPDYYHLEIYEQFLTCKLCNLSVINSVDNARKHVGSVSHDEKYKELLKSNRLTQDGDCYFECNFCNDKAILKGTELFHILNNDHKFFSDAHSKTEQEFKFQKLTKIEYPAKNLSKLQPILTDLPKVSANPNPMLREDELPSCIRRFAKKKKLHCKVCEVNLPYSKRNVEEHIGSAKHKKKYIESLAKIENEKVCNVTKDKETNPSTDFGKSKLQPILADLPKVDVKAKPNTKSSADELPSCIRSTSVLGSVHCTVCEVNLPNTKRNVEEHIGSTKHKQKYTESLENLKNEKVCKVTKDKENNPYIDLGELFIEQTINEKNAFCTICQSEISNRIDCIREHLKGKRHSKESKVFLKNNHIEIDLEKNTFYCEVCKAREAVTSLTEHIQSPSHKPPIGIKVKDATRCYCCLCKAYVSNHEKNIEEHKNGNVHRANMK